MSKQQVIEQLGTVQQELGNSMFRVILDSTGHEIVCTISGKIRKNYIRIIVGDRVRLEMSPYDLNRGRIVTRLSIKKESEDEQAAKESSSSKHKKK